MKKLNSQHQKYSLREQILIFLFEQSKPVYRKLFKRKTLAWNKSMSQLKSYPKESLGYDLAMFLQKNNFKLEPKLEKHDVYHVLTGYQTTVQGEIALSFFNIGVGKRSLYTLGVAFIGLVFMLDKFNTFYKAYQRGKTAIDYSRWDFESLLYENTEALKKYILTHQNELELYI